MKSVGSGRLGQALRRDIIVAACFAVVMALLPFANLSNYTVGQLALFFLWSCVVIQWNIVFGVAGIMSLGQVAVFAFGAYTTAMIATYTNVPFWLSFLMSAPGAVIFSLLLGVLTLRLRGEYVAIVTLAIAILLATLIINDVECFRRVDLICYPLTGGTRGLMAYGDFHWAAMLGFKHRHFGDYYLLLTIMIGSLLVSLLVIHGPFGLAFRAIRDNETYASARGIDFGRIQLIVFALSAVMTGLAGGAYAGVVKTVGTSVLEIDLLAFLLSMMIVGGRGSTWGPIIGSAALMIADYNFQSMGGWRTGALAAITILFIVLYPRGLAGALSSFISLVSSLGERSSKRVQLDCLEASKAVERG